MIRRIELTMSQSEPWDCSIIPHICVTLNKTHTTTTMAQDKETVELMPLTLRLLQQRKLEVLLKETIEILKESF